MVYYKFIRENYVRKYPLIMAPGTIDRRCGVVASGRTVQALMRTLIPARYAGLLRFPSACREGERIRIVSGSLKDVGGKIRRIDVRYLWSLTTPPSPPEPGFELIDSVDGSGGSVVIIVSGQLNSQLTGN